jgi:hypothetical protein
VGVRRLPTSVFTPLLTCQQNQRDCESGVCETSGLESGAGAAGFGCEVSSGSTPSEASLFFLSRGGWSGVSSDEIATSDCTGLESVTAAPSCSASSFLWKVWDSLRLTAKKLFGNLTVWNFALRVSMTSFQSACAVRLRLGAQLIQCLLSSCTSKGSKVWQPGLMVIRIL